MTFEEALVAELATIPTISGRVYPLSAPEKTKPPYVRFTSSPGVPDKSLTAFLGSRRVSCDIDVIAASYSAMKPLADAVTGLLQDMQGRAIGTAGPFIQSVEYDEPTELYESAVGWHRTNIRTQFYF